MSKPPLRILVLSGLGRDSGCMLRARYLTAALVKAGARARLPNTFRTFPFFLDTILNSIWNLRLLGSRCDVIIGCKPLPSITPLLMLKRWLGTYTVIDIDDLDYEYRTGFLRWLTRTLQRPFPRRLHLVTYHNDALAAIIVDVFGVSPDRLFQVQQGVALEIFTPCPAGLEDSIETGPVIVYPAHLNIASDLGAVFDIVSRVRAELPALTLRVVGGGPREGYFRRLAREKGVDTFTEFTGHVSPETVSRYLAGASLGLVWYGDEPVNYYRSSMKLREMLACGLRVVCTDIGECREFSSFTYQASPSPIHVAARILEVLRAGGDGREKAGCAFVRQALDWNIIGTRFYEKLLDVQGSASGSATVCTGQISSSF